MEEKYNAYETKASQVIERENHMQQLPEPKPETEQNIEKKQKN